MYYRNNTVYLNNEKIQENTVEKYMQRKEER